MPKFYVRVDIEIVGPSNVRPIAAQLNGSSLWSRDPRIENLYFDPVRVLPEIVMLMMVACNFEAEAEIIGAAMAQSVEAHLSEGIREQRYPLMQAIFGPVEVNSYSE